jgi:hypothetical protein
MGPGPMVGLHLPSVLKRAGFPESQCSAFGKALETSEKFSIDAFLENRREFQDIGRAAIAVHIAQCESRSVIARGGRPDRDWLRYFYNQLGATIEDHVSQGLSVISYNYDRSFEAWFERAWAADYPTPIESARKSLAQLKVIHVHGMIGEQDFGVAPDELDVRAAASGVRLVFDKAEDSKVYKQARAAIQDAETICFLGFGYDSVNVGRLGIYNQWPEGTYGAKFGHPLPAQKRVIGSVFGLTAAEIDRARGMFSVPADLDSEAGNQDALRFLRESVLLKRLGTQG